jgi:N6-adenosine-specific RNA methylase IME4
MKFRTIVADPPWQYPNATLWQRPQSVPDEHYPTLSVEQIKSLPIKDVMDKNCAIWLWVPTYHLIRGIGVEVVEHWGFRPMTTMIWCKRQIGLGHYLRNAHEPILLAVKGKYPLKVKDQKSWFIADRKEHSRKPDQAYNIIKRCSYGPFLELFARTKRNEQAPNFFDLMILLDGGLILINGKI